MERQVNDCSQSEYSTGESESDEDDTDDASSSSAGTHRTIVYVFLLTLKQRTRRAYLLGDAVLNIPFYIQCTFNTGAVFITATVWSFTRHLRAVL